MPAVIRSILGLTDTVLAFRNQSVFGGICTSRRSRCRRPVTAPLVGIVSMRRDLGPADALSLGVYLQTLILALLAQGLGTCVEVSVAGYPDIVRNKLKIPPELTIICALAVGYPDPDFPTNKLRIGRDPAAKHVVFLDGECRGEAGEREYWTTSCCPDRSDSSSMAAARR